MTSPKSATPNGSTQARRLRIFVSHCIDDKKFVFEVCDHLAPYLGRENMYLFEERPVLGGQFLPQIESELSRAHLILIFVGKRCDQYMQYEAMRTSTLKNKDVCMINISGRKDLPDNIKEHVRFRHTLKDNYTGHIPVDTIRCAKDILEALSSSERPPLKGMNLRWNDQNWRYGLPSAPYVFDYEKEIIRFYLAKRCHEILDQGLSPEEAERLRQKYRGILADWTPEKVQKTLEKGIAADWPSVARYPARESNPLTKDTLRGQDDESLLRVNALMGLDVPGEPLVFLEAGPRPRVALPTHRNLKVAIVVSGGIAPGINAVVDAIVQRHYAYHDAARRAYNLEIVGLKNGLLAFEKDKGVGNHIRRLTPSDTIENATRGGSMLGTSRDEGLLDADPAKRSARLDVIARELKNQEIDVLYVIGGDGSMKAAHALWHKVNADSFDGSRMSVVAIPKTMDNDILWVWQSFGFLSAVQEAREIVERLHTEVRSNPRLGIVQFFGSGSGFVVSHAVLAAATGHTTLALIPERDFSVLGVARYVKQRLWESARPYESEDPATPIDASVPHGLIVMGETAIPLDALECLGLISPPADLKEFYDAVATKVRPTDVEEKVIRDFFEHGRRVQGQTSDTLRSLGIKLLNELLPILIRHPNLNRLIAPDETPGWKEPNWDNLRMVRNEPRYLVRALEPSTSDIITGQRLGLLAVDAAMAGYTDCMVSQWLTEFSIVPLELVVLGRKRIPPSGMFWKSVTSKTRQPDDLVPPYPSAGSAPPFSARD